MGSCSRIEVDIYKGCPMGTPGALYMMGMRVSRHALHLLLQPKWLSVADLHRRREVELVGDGDSHQIDRPQSADRGCSISPMISHDGAAFDLELGENGAKKSNAQEDRHDTELGLGGLTISCECV